MKQNTYQKSLRRVLLDMHMGEEPNITDARATMGATGVDLSINANMSFPNGTKASINCSMPETGEFTGNLVIKGAFGQLEAKKPILPHLGGTLIINTLTQQRTVQTDTQSTFYYQLVAIAQSIREGGIPTVNMKDSTANAKTMDAIKEVARV